MSHPWMLVSLLSMVAVSSGNVATAPHTMSDAIVGDSGVVSRRDIPNDFLEVSLPAGSVNVVGTSEADVHWSTTTSSPMVVSPSTSRYALKVNAGGTVRPNIVLRVPESLRLIHVKVLGGGGVKLSGLGGEVNVVIDSGSIIGQDLRGTLTLEARHGDIRLNLASRTSQRSHVVALAQQGIIELTLNAKPSISLDLATVCGQVASEFALSKEIPASPVLSPVSGIRGSTGVADCRRGNRWSPPMPGAPMEVAVQSNLGDGTTALRARAIQGDILIRSAATSVAAAPQQGRNLTIARELRIDGNAADLSSIGTILVGRDGSIVVSQPQDGHLKYFSADGKALGTFGRKGGGPGEFQHVTRVGWTGDSLWVYDRTFERITVISPDRKLVRDLRMPDGSLASDKDRGFQYFFGPWGLMPDGRVVLMGTALPASESKRTPPKADMALTVPLIPASPDFHAVAIIRRPGVGNCGFENECPRIEPTLNAVDTRFVDAEPVTREVKDGAYLYRITAHDATGKTLWVKTMSIAGPPLTKRETDSIRAASLVDLKGRQGRMTASDYAAAEFEIRRHKYPSIKVPLTLIYTGRDGSTWLRLRGNPRPWMVLDKNGNVYGRVSTPASFNVYAVSLDALWGTESAADGSDDIVRYSVKVGNR